MPPDAQFDVFLSYSSHDGDVVRDLADRLKRDGLRVWFDEWEIDYGDSIPVKIEEGLANSRIVVLCMSAHASGSDWATLESRTILFKDPLNRKKRLKPLRLDDAEIPGPLAQFKYLDWQTPSPAAYKKILVACSKKEVAASSNPSPKPAPVKAPTVKVPTVAAFPQGAMTVFISYAWENDAFRNRVRALRDWLISQEIAVVSDFDHLNRAPKKGWQTWMQHGIEDATVVLAVCSPKYKSRFEKRAAQDAGKGVAWEGAIITQELYDAAQQNGKFYPLFLDPVTLADMPKALASWNNGHSFPSRQAGILALIRECFAERDAEAGSQEAQPLVEVAASVEQPAPLLPTDIERMAQTREAILNCLHRSHFDGLPKLGFAQDGMPQPVADVFSAGQDNLQRHKVADACSFAILKFAGKVVEAFGNLPADSPVCLRKNKNLCWKGLVNAMQHAILLSSKQNYCEKRRIDDAYNPDKPCEVQGMSWLSASMIMRESLAETLRSNSDYSGDAEDDPLEDNLADDWSVIERGTGDKAKVEGYKAIKFLLDRGTFPDNPTQKQIQELQGELRLRKMEGFHMLIFSQKAAALPLEFICWLKTDMHVGHITILAQHGEFELIEGNWRAYLVKLLKVLREFEPEPMRPRMRSRTPK